ncbi:xanthine dehydrogenase YagR molybdenum-binding subunit [Sphingomonas guangdongensis]|uniref:Xanthine dehydrogenase YagR molybdenum-binding subunit n=1 Tax=Sphingomonas guangdongensis TaxID=1141890 RepID=A0A285QZR4_9SPHN|nr:aldehyde oxidoreductase molybdenum-binding subunit PaoC [Sphingomonas guangdongensis]SOB87383.1 xanthine dehydrogenase YagR molybdenum-binding subunit [Sphingomonas guangdongensis]
MEFTAPAETNLFDNAKVVGKSTLRIDGPLKTTGRAPYAYERHDVAPDAAYGYLVGSAVAKGRLTALDTRDAANAPGVIGIVSTLDHSAPLPTGTGNNTALFGGAEIRHYHQAIACVVAETFEQARAAAALIRPSYARVEGKFDLAAAAPSAPMAKDGSGKPDNKKLGDFDAAFASAPVKIDQRYTTPDESHAMMEPFATTAAWEGDKLTLWTANQMIAWCKSSMATILSIPKENVRAVAPYIGGGFGGKLFVRADAVVAALAARKLKRPVKVAMQRPLMVNNATHRQGTIQRIRIGAGRDGRITALAHENWSSNINGQDGENGTAQTASMYAGPNRLQANYTAQLDLPEGNAMRAPGEAVGHLALEVAIDELAEAVGMDPVELRILNEPATVPGTPEKKFSDRNLVRCLREGAARFGWDKRQAKPGTVRDGRWLVGMGVAAGYRGSPTMKSAARATLENGRVVIETDMTDIGTGSYTIIAQTAAETMGVPLAQVDVRLGDSDDPVSAGSGGQWGAASSTAGTYAVCLALRRAVGQKLGFDGDAATFTDGRVVADNRSWRLADAGNLSVTDEMNFGRFKRDFDIGTYAGHFAEVGVDRYTGEIRIRRMLAVCDAGRILNPLSARSQVIGAMVMAAGSALMEELAVDKRFGFFVNHDLAGYEVPVHADIPHQECVFLDTLDPVISPLKAKGVGELGICGPGSAVANAVYNATGIRIRDYPITLDKHLDRLPQVA